MSNEIKTIEQLAKSMKVSQGLLDAIAMKNNISAESGEELSPQQIATIKSVYENQSKSAPRLAGSAPAQGLTEQAPSAPVPTQRPVLKVAQENFSGAVQARDTNRQDIAIQRLEEAQRRGQHAGALSAIVENTSMIDAEFAVTNAIRAGEIEGLAQLDEAIAKTLGGSPFLDRFTSTQQSYAERPIAPTCNKVQETLDALKNLKTNFSS